MPQNKFIFDLKRSMLICLQHHTTRQDGSCLAGLECLSAFHFQRKIYDRETPCIDASPAVMEAAGGRQVAKVLVGCIQRGIGEGGF